MRDLRLVTSDENGMTLEALDGEKFILAVDDSVKAAVRASGSKSVDDTKLTPRDIQDLVRSGLTIDEIVAQSGADAHFVETFALPVMDELEHMVASARSVRLTIPGDRFSDDSQIEFGELVDRRLIDNGAAGVTWSSKRGESAVWLVSVAFELSGNFGVASWLFDPRKVELTAEDETAGALSVLDGNPGPLPKSRFATEPPAAFRKPSQTGKSEKADKVTVAPVIDIAAARDAQVEEPVEATVVRETASPLPDQAATNQAEPVVMNVTTLQFKTETVELVEETEPEAVAPVSESEHVVLVVEPDQEQVEEIDTDQATHDDEVDAVGEAIDSIDALDIADEPIEDDIPEVDIASDLPTEDDSAEIEPPTSTGSIGLPKKGRASMPTWDEIVFGTKTDD